MTPTAGSAPSSPTWARATDAGSLAFRELHRAGLAEHVAVHVVCGDSEVRSLAVHGDRRLESGAPLGAGLLKLGRRAAREYRPAVQLSGAVPACVHDRAAGLVDLGRDGGL